MMTALGAAAATAGIRAAIDLARDVIKTLLKGVTERRVQAGEVQALTDALAMEIAELIIALERRYEWWTPRAGQEWLPPLVPFYTEAFDQLRSKIERVPADLVAPTIRFYGYIRFLNGQHETREEYLERGLQDEFHSTYAQALETQIGIGQATLEAFRPHLTA